MKIKLFAFIFIGLTPLISFAQLYEPEIQVVCQAKCERDRGLIELLAAEDSLFNHWSVRYADRTSSDDITSGFYFGAMNCAYIESLVPEDSGRLSELNCISLDNQYNLSLLYDKKKDAYTLQLNATGDDNPLIVSSELTCSPLTRY